LDWSEKKEVVMVEAVLDGYSKADEYGNSKI